MIRPVSQSAPRIFLTHLLTPSTLRITSLRMASQTVKEGISESNLKESAVKPGSPHCLSSVAGEDMQCNDSKFTRPNKQEKKAARQEGKKRLERERKAMRKLKNRVESKTNFSDVITNEELNRTSYYSENGLRKVYPYNFFFNTHAKGRWYDKKISEIFTKEFNIKGESLEMTLKNGQLMVNNEKVTGDYIIKANDRLSHNVHRHERPVLDTPIEIIEDSDTLLVINKPSSIPVHPCGKHRFNSISYILAKEHGYKNLRVLFRLDRLTSGVLMLGKSQGRAHEVTTAIEKRQTEKTYVCRVEGEFPRGVVECRQGLKVLAPSIGLQVVAEDGKQAHTTFERLSFNGKSSVVQCVPHTGRTHQIRVHLQYLGHPIVNDNLYNQEAWGPRRGKDGQYGKTLEQLVEDIFKSHSPDNILSKKEIDSICHDYKYGESKDPRTKNNYSHGVKKIENIKRDTNLSEVFDNEKRTGSIQMPRESAKDIDKVLFNGPESKRQRLNSDTTSNRASNRPADKANTINLQESNSSLLSLNSENDMIDGITKVSNTSLNGLPHYDVTRMTYDPNCVECHHVYEDPDPAGMVMYLHAWKNKGPTWEYSTDLPVWANEALSD